MNASSHEYATDATINAAIQVNNVSRAFGTLHAVKNVSLAIPSGTIVGLLGPNGAGKTTLIRMCAGWLDADEGEVFLAGKRHTRDTHHTRRALGVVSRDAPLYNEFTVAQTLRLHAGFHGMSRAESRAACADICKTYHLDAWLSRRVGVLSTGMRQRVALAVALLHSPRVLLLDEPTVGLDPDVREHIWKLLRAAADRGVAMLLSTHYFDEAAHVCDRAHLLTDGNLGPAIYPQDEPHAVQALEKAFHAITQWEVATV